MSSYKITDKLRAGAADVSNPGGVSVTDGLGGVVTLRAASGTTSYTLTLPPDTGSVGEVLTENTGTGSTIWAVPPSPIYSIWYIRDQKGAGVNAGTAGAINTWLTRDLNTLVKPSGTGTEVTLSSNQIILQDGVYWIEAWVPSADTQQVATRLRDVTNNINITNGSTSITNPGFGTLSTVSNVRDVHTVTGGPIAVEVQQYFKSITNPNNLGLATGITNEIYTIVNIQLVG
jgi:hypothetical protein